MGPIYHSPNLTSLSLYVAKLPTRDAAYEKPLRKTGLEAHRDRIAKFRVLDTWF